MGEFDECDSGFESSQDIYTDVSSDDFSDFGGEDSADNSDLCDSQTESDSQEYTSSDDFSDFNEEDYSDANTEAESQLESDFQEEEIYDSPDELDNSGNNKSFEEMSEEEKAYFINELRNGHNPNLDQDYEDLSTDEQSDVNPSTSETDDSGCLTGDNNDNSCYGHGDDNDNSCYGHGDYKMETYDSDAAYPESHFAETDDRYLDEQSEATEASNNRARRELEEFQRQQDQERENEYERKLQTEQEQWEAEQSQLDDIEDDARQFANESDERIANSKTDEDSDALHEENKEAHRKLDNAIYNSCRHSRGM